MTEAEFLRFVGDELALPLGPDAAGGDLDQAVHWDSIHFLRLVTALERRTGRRLPIGALLAEPSLRAIYQRVADEFV